MGVLGGIVARLAAKAGFRNDEKIIDILIGENWTPEHLKKIEEIGKRIEQCVDSVELKFEDAKAPDAKYVLTYFREARGWYIELSSHLGGNPERYERVKDSLADSLKARAFPSEPRMVDGRAQRVDVMVPTGRLEFGGIAFCMGNFYADYGGMIQNPVMTARLSRVPESLYQNAVEAGIPLK